MPLSQLAMLALFVIACVAVTVWRAMRRERWSAAGLCYQCGGRLGWGARTFTDFSGRVTAKKVQLCARCARHRTIWVRIVVFLCLAIVVLVWYSVRHS